MDLADFLRPLVKSGLPAAPTAPWPEPVTRQWPPLRSVDVDFSVMPTSDQIAFSERHPALELPCFRRIEARKIGRSPRSSSRGRQARYFCPKTGRTLRAASDGEYFLMLWRQIDPNKSGMVEDPITVRCRAPDGTRLKHRPDLFELRVREPWFVESKYEAKAAKTEWKWELFGSALSQIGFGYEVITERHTRQPVRFANINRIWLARRSLPDWPDVVAAVNEVKRQLEKESSCTIGTLLHALPALTFRQVLSLTYHNALPTDLDLVLSTKSPLFSPPNDEPLRRIRQMITTPYSVAP
jgi:hypothetical protein